MFTFALFVNQPQSILSIRSLSLLFLSLALLLFGPITSAHSQPKTQYFICKLELFCICLVIIIFGFFFWFLEISLLVFLIFGGDKKCWRIFSGHFFKITTKICQQPTKKKKYTKNRFKICINIRKMSMKLKNSHQTPIHTHKHSIFIYVRVTFYTQQIQFALCKRAAFSNNFFSFGFSFAFNSVNNDMFFFLLHLQF